MRKTKDPLMEKFSKFKLEESERKLILGGYVYGFHTDTGFFFEEYDENGYVTAYNVIGQDIGSIPCEENYL